MLNSNGLSSTGSLWSLCCVSVQCYDLGGGCSQWLTTMIVDGDAFARDQRFLGLTLDVRVVSAPQTRTASLDEPATLPRDTTPTSEGQCQKSSEDGPDVSVRSPVRCVSPEFVNAIAMNPGGRPKEVRMCKLLWRLFLKYQLQCMQSTVFMNKLADSVITFSVSLQNIIWME